MLNKGFGALVGLSLGHNYFWEVQGRKTYRVFSTPVDLLESWGRASSLLLGEHNRVRNAEAAGQIALKRGVQRRRFQIRIVPDDEKSEILKEDLDRFNLTVQRYFLIEAGSKSR